MKPEDEQAFGEEGKKLASKARAKRKTSGSPEACFQDKFNQ